MNCEDLLDIVQLKKGLKLIAGDCGLKRDIRWLYFADCIQCLNDDDNIREYIHGGELVIITNETLTGNEERILEIIKIAEEKSIAGIVINQNQILDSVKELCNILEIPLFEASLDLHFIDFSQIICKALVEEESNENSIERILSTVLFEERFSSETIIEQAQYYGINLKRNQVTIVFKMDNFSKNIENNNNFQNSYYYDINENIKKMIKKEFSSYGLRHIMILIQNEFAVAVIPKEMFSEDLLTVILKNIIKNIEMKYKVKISVGVGDSYNYIDEIKTSYKEAKETIKLSKILNLDKNNDGNIYYYHNLGIYSFITQIKNDKFLDDYKNRKLKLLEDSDKMQDSSLCETLEAYLANNCNANATAESLFIHRNTMRYRMEKIKKLTNIDFNDISLLLEFRLAFAIKKYRENIK
ncbi:transcriptional regulator [Clostridium butyricum]|uniref:Transcriptional regulator n=1 Tax=Clostridium butyricum TaxID=1492 RepID=A0A512TLV9_CLOBU|nr:PucR family transcriptional regulator [Clostridium butyricum]NOW24422.1 sugar diacid utilization regulator [Clostridium butyricum]GEQ21250.1 transcriptional regulator [Clostridium butyricum]